MEDKKQGAKSQQTPKEQGKSKMLDKMRGKIKDLGMTDKKLPENPDEI